MKQRIIELKLSRVSRIFLFCFGECSSLFDVEIKSGAKKEWYEGKNKNSDDIYIKDR